jgi:hypothetical protein
MEPLGRSSLRNHVSHGDDTVTTGSDDRERQVPCRHGFSSLKRVISETADLHPPQEIVNPFTSKVHCSILGWMRVGPASNRELKY